jgi:hypothetical protein
MRVGFLRNVAGSAGAECLKERVFLAWRGHHEEGRAGESRGDGANGQRRVVRQADVDEAGVRAFANRGLQRVRAVCNLCTNDEALLLERPPYAQARKRLRIGDENASEPRLRARPFASPTSA